LGHALPVHVAKLLPRVANVFTISPAEGGFDVTLFWRGHRIEVMTAGTLPEARRLAAQLSDEGATGFIEGTL
jgi:hypothetical protein